MDLEQIEAVLMVALKLRSPHFAPGHPPRSKIAELEDYLLRSASVNGELVEALHWCREAGVALGDAWEQLEGWEVALRRPRAKATRQEIQAAKMRTSPQLYEAGRKARRLRESLVDQIARLEREERVVSRAYTMVTGS